MFGPNRFQPHLEILHATYSENESEMFVWYNMEHIFIAFNSCTEHIDVDITFNSLIRTKTSPLLRLAFIRSFTSFYTKHCCWNRWANNSTLTFRCSHVLTVHNYNEQGTKQKEWKGDKWQNIHLVRNYFTSSIEYIFLFPSY